MLDPGINHWYALCRVLGYLRRTVDYKITYGKGNDELIAYADASYASDLDNRRSVSGFVLMFAGAAVSYSSKLQTTVALSSVESEYMSASDCVRESLYVSRLLDFLYNIRKPGMPVTLFDDAEGCIKLAGNETSTKRTRHISVRYHFIREHIESGKIVMKYVRTTSQLADIFTKNVNGEVLWKATGKILGMF
jgi:hypothetical protein